jgi:Cupin-like domain
MIESIDEINDTQFTKELFDTYFLLDKPLVVRNLFSESKACKEWSRDFFLVSTEGIKREAQVIIYEKSSDKHEQFFDKKKTATMDLSEALHKVSSPASQNEFHNLLGTNIPELIDQIEIPDYLSDKTQREYGFVWLGNGNVTGLHFDTPNNYYFQIKGHKVFHLFEPSNFFYFYPLASNTGSMVDMDHVDLEKYPLFRKTRRVKVQLAPGDFLYLPPFWWHQVESSEPYVSLNYFGAPRIDQCFNYPGYYEILKYFELGQLIQMIQSCNQKGFEKHSLLDIVEYILFKGYNWASFLLITSLIEQTLLKCCHANEIEPDNSITERTKVLSERMDRAELNQNNILLENLGETRLFDIIHKISKKSLLDEEIINNLYSLSSCISIAKMKDNVAITPARVNHFIQFYEKLEEII